MKKPMTRIVSVRFSQADIQMLKDLAKKHRVNVSALIRLNLAETLEKGGVKKEK